MKRLMIDLETMSLEHNAAIASIGAVVFDEHSTLEEFYATVDLEDCQNNGLHVSASTLYWWMSQSDEARKAITSDKLELWEAICELKSWLNRVGFDPTWEVWANGSKDCQWLESTCKALGTDPILAFYQERDFRTFKSLHDEVHIPDETVAHNALADARWQARYMLEVGGTIT